MLKAKISVLALTAVLLLGMSGNALAVNSFNFLGETTWTVTVNEDQSGPITPKTLPMTGAISKLGPNYYLFQGFVPIPADNPLFLAGEGTLVTLPGAQTQTLVLTLSNSQQHSDSSNKAGERDLATVHVELNPDLSGTLYVVEHGFDKVSKNFTQSFTAGLLTRTGGNGSFNPQSTARQLPLWLD